MSNRAIKSHIRFLAGAVALAAMMTVVAAFGELASPAPEPVIGMPDAIELARAELIKGYALVGKEMAPPKEYLLSSAIYKKGSGGIWYWEISFAHPTYPDHIAQYVVHTDRAVELYDSRPHPDDLAPSQLCDMEAYMDQISLSLCSEHNDKRLDSELNVVYRQQLARLKGTPDEGRLKAAQRQWLKYVEADCFYQNGPREGAGTIWPEYQNECLMAHTKRRIELLTTFLECTSAGCPGE